MENVIFKNKTPDFEKLAKYGFENKQGKFVFVTEIVDGTFRMTVEVTNGGVQTELYEKDAGEIYTLHLYSEAVGAFVGRVRAEHEKVLIDIAEKCFERDVFKTEFAMKILEYAYQKYGDQPEFLWEKHPEYAVLRRKDNEKWYAILMRIPKNRLGLDEKDIVEIVDLRFDVDQLPTKVDGEKYFFGYHMNKKHWITIRLDGCVPLAEILDYIDKSFVLAK